MTPLSDQAENRGCVGYQDLKAPVCMCKDQHRIRVSFHIYVCLQTCACIADESFNFPSSSLGRRIVCMIHGTHLSVSWHTFE